MTVLIGNDGTEIEEKLNHLNDESRKIGLKINMKKTKVMFNENTTKSAIHIGTQVVEQVSEYILGTASKNGK